ncbi:MAG: endonuclease III [Smithellaceae bacterium]|nr:endonuclease III [Smithellaceae bacterium]
MKDDQIDLVIKLIRKHLRKTELPIVSLLAKKRYDPFAILLSTLLSLRTKDEVTAVATERLFKLAKTPETMLKVPAERIATAIYPVGFYRTKADTILSVCRDLVQRYSSRVPDTIEELLSLKGVGRKTANLVVSLGYSKPAICVDTHVHRISNRLGYVRTKTPEQTEFALREKLPLEYWSEYNTLLVAFGRETCKPISPLCSKCPVFACCERMGVTKSR